LAQFLAWVAHDDSALGEIAQLSRADDEPEAVFLTGSGVGSRLIWREFSHMWRGSSSEVAEVAEPQLHMLQSRRFMLLSPE
jgi:hypothetical protein